jgi:hypothetical protein
LDQYAKPDTPQRQGENHAHTRSVETSRLSRSHPHRVVDLLHWQQKRKPLRQRSSPEVTRRSQRRRRTKWSSRPDKGAPTSCIAPPVASDPRSIATNPVLYQVDYQLFGVGVVARCKEDGTRFVRREFLYPGHRHVTDRFDKPCARRHLGDQLAGCAPRQLQRGPRSATPARLIWV